ncbi:MAG: AmmeMemoRadiSam system protein B [Candidatus Gygaella obscura]|nr:AmmeMemoRadiSam system protein B [Candidatus Gygaella obscura]
MVIVRYPVVAGKFYPGEKDKLSSMLKDLVTDSNQKKDCLGCILPHAGYVYSGKVAGKTISEVEIKNTCIIIGPNHTGMGKKFSVFAEGKWQTPLGDVKIDHLLAKDLIKNCSLLEPDILAHRYEHSIEVILPFLQFLKADVEIVPIVAGLSNNFEDFITLAVDLAKTLKKNGRVNDILIIVSSDMTHMESRASVEKKDKAAIDEILKLDEQALFDVVQEFDISMCGYIPAIIMLKSVKELGAKKAQLVTYDTSASITKDQSSAVGYAGIIIERN